MNKVSPAEVVWAVLLPAAAPQEQSWNLHPWGCLIRWPCGDMAQLLGSTSIPPKGNGP